MSEYQEVETIIGKKLSKGKVLYCVKWKHMGVLNSTWETVDSFANLKKLKAMSKMLDVRCRRIKKKRIRDKKERERENRRLGKGVPRRGRRRKGDLRRHVLLEESQEKDESVYCVFQDEYVVDIGSEVFKQNRRLKNCWEERLAREKEKRVDVGNDKENEQEDSVDEIVVIHSKSKSSEIMKKKSQTEKLFSNKNVLYNFDDSLNPQVRDDISQDTSLICKRHSNQAVETLGLCDLKKKHDQKLFSKKIEPIELSGSGEPECLADKAQSVIFVD